MRVSSDRGIRVEDTSESTRTKKGTLQVLLRNGDYCPDFTYAREKQRECCIIWLVTKNQNTTKVKKERTKQKNKNIHNKNCQF